MVKRTIIMIVGILLFIVGASAAVGGGALTVIFGSDGTLTSASEPLSTSRSALVATMDDIEGTSGFASVVGRPTLKMSVTGAGRDVFIGVGPAKAVEQYLTGSSIDRITDLEVDPFKLKTAPRDGSARPAAPASQTFWTAHATGPTASFDWKISDGSYRLVVMNADASPSVNANSRLGLTVPHVFAIGLGILIGGVLIALVGIGLFIVAIRMRRQPRSATPVTTAYPVTSR
ncbi:MAG: hypothetical protein QOG01_731 [Pseudonocardiales bacterium]|jgi:hypothetical protein|nr:hypothetical protein [Pseudonocardiales bacterium]